MASEVSMIGPFSNLTNKLSVILQKRLAQITKYSFPGRLFSGVPEQAIRALGIECIGKSPRHIIITKGWVLGTEALFAIAACNQRPSMVLLESFQDNKGITYKNVIAEIYGLERTRALVISLQADPIIAPPQTLEALLNAPPPQSPPVEDEGEISRDTIAPLLAIMEEIQLSLLADADRGQVDHFEVARCELTLIGAYLNAGNTPPNISLGALTDHAKSILEKLYEELTAPVSVPPEKRTSLPGPELTLEPCSEDLSLPEEVVSPSLPPNTTPPTISFDWSLLLAEQPNQALEYLQKNNDVNFRIMEINDLMQPLGQEGHRLYDYIVCALNVLLTNNVKGIEIVMERISKQAKTGEIRTHAEICGAVNELVRLAMLQMISPPDDPITQISADLGPTVFFPEILNGHDGGARFVPEKEKTISQQIEADGFREKSRTLIEIKHAARTVEYNSKDDEEAQRELKLRNQARKYAAAIRDGIINAVEYHITAGQFDQRLIDYLTRIIPAVKIYVYPSMTSDTGELRGQSVPKVTKAGESGKPAQRDWSEAAWIWAFTAFCENPGKYSSFSGEPINVRKNARAAQFSQIFDGLQTALDQLLKNNHFIDQHQKQEIESLKHDINTIWRKRLVANDVGTAAVCEFSLVLERTMNLLDV
jgi:hypothetical protein